MRLACVASSAFFFLQSSLASAHSWLECTDYQMRPNTDDNKFWNVDACHGRARCAGRQIQAGFGVDTGLNRHDEQCQCTRGSADDTAPRATYKPGQRVCLAYPPKNHVAAPCTNAFIPDAGVKITRSKVLKDGDTSDEFDGRMSYKNSNGEHQDGQIDYKGFQNCPNFCDDMNGALCTMCFDLESDIAPGNYSFKWAWSFNTETDTYTNCWEAEVKGSSGGPAAPVQLMVGAEAYDAQPQVHAAPTNPEDTSAPTPTPTSAAPNSTPTVTTAAPSPAAYTGNDADCEDELDMAGGDANEDCEDELGMAGQDADCEEELEMPGGVGEVGGDADTGHGNSNPFTYDDGNVGADHPNPNPPRQPAAGGGHGNAESQETGAEYGGSVLAPNGGTGAPTSDSNSNNNANAQGPKQPESGHGQSGDSNQHNGNYPAHDTSKPDKQFEGTPAQTKGQSESAKPPIEPGCDQEFTLPKEKKPDANTGANGASNGTPAAYPSNPQAPETQPAPAPAPAPASQTGGGGAENGNGQGNQYSSESAGHEAEKEPDCDETLPIADHPASTPPAAATGDNGEAAGEAKDEEPDCEETMPYSYDTSAPAVQGEADTPAPETHEEVLTLSPEVQGDADTEVQGEADCDKGIPIADKKSASNGHGNRRGHGQGNSHGYGNDNGHGDGDGNKHHSDSYSFHSEDELEQETSSYNNADVNPPAGVVQPYSGA